ncbi:MAG TPA: hypothetical protein VM487_16925, partial [Phycisphaerae bacterium]|nr:hypothetical protein [Phycisphaerae bacterium]
MVDYLKLTQDQAKVKADAEAHFGAIIEEMEAEAAHLEDLLKAKDALLGEARYELTLLDGWHAADSFAAFGDALADGCDANGAWDCFRES